MPNPLWNLAKRGLAAGAMSLRGGVEAATTPLIDPETARSAANLIEGTEAAPTQGGFFDAVQAIPDVARMAWDDPFGTARNYIAGGVEGLASLSDPLTLATLPFGGEGKAIGTGAKAGVRGVDAAMGVMPKAPVSRMLPKGGGGSSAMDELAEMFGKYGDDAADVAPSRGRVANNASGDSSASIEAMNRLKQEAAQGKQRVRLDRAGRETPLIGTDAVDQSARAGETIAFRLPDGSYQIIEQGAGARLPPNIRQSLPGLKPR